MKRRIIAALLCVALLCALLSSTVALAESYRGIVKVGSMNIYSDSAMKRKIGSLACTTVVKVESVSKDVARINYNGNRGYASVTQMYNIDKIARAATTNKKAQVYRSASTLSPSVTVKKGFALNVLATYDGWVMVENDSNIGYMLQGDVTYKTTTLPTAAPTAAPTQAPAATYSAQVTVSKMKVYAGSSTSSKCLGTLPKGTVVTVLSANKTWANIRLNGNTGYAKVAQLKKVAEGTTAAPTKGNTSNYLNSSSYSVQEKIYLYCTQEIGMNCAAACGILANVQRECDFRVNCGSSDGGYGIVQWTGSRNTKLKTWCKSNGYDYTTLTGQLNYLKYDLKNNYSKVLKYLNSVDNSPAGAYDAAYYFCYNFEIPANRLNSSIVRGNLAKDKYWPIYSKW